MISKFIEWMKKVLQVLPHPVRWATIVVLGFALVIIGLIFMVLPGPGIPVVIAGLAILSLEFVWAQEAVKNGEQWLEKLVRRLKTFFKKK
ncbi:MAG: PGPGW domain-containing protein [Micrococcales bacterium]